MLYSRSIHGKEALGESRTAPIKKGVRREPDRPLKKGPLMAQESDYQPGSMDISAHKKAYQGFLTGSKWTFGFILLIMVFLAIFRTHG